MEARRWRGYLKNERGSGTLLIMVGMVIAAIFFGFLFFDFSNVFINKRVTQTGADAAAIAAAQTANKYMREHLQEKTQEKLEDLGDEWEEFLEGILAGYEDDGDPETPPPVPPTENEIFAMFVAMKEAALGKKMPGDIRSWLRNNSVSVEAETAMKFFFTEEEVSDMSCSAVRLHLDEAEKEAELYAEKNQNDRLSDLKFIPEDFRIYVETERKGKYTTVPNSEVPAITSTSSAKIGEPNGFNISCN